ncbi:MAG: type II toxin-antitoxin system VapC family toxin [Verrucomicrobia bacterium]|nr:MAG: type II toxin-antitoxin system VapC family toxin [Verrucomicrobiota bacterium]
MEVTVVLDTNAYSDWRRSGKWAGNVATATRVVIPSVVLGELEFGFLQGARRAENRRKLREFLQHSRVEVAVVDHRTAEIYAEFLQHLREKGKPIPTNDIWIATQAWQCGGELATRDEHFAELPMLHRAVEFPLP